MARTPEVKNYFEAFANYLGSFMEVKKEQMMQLQPLLEVKLYDRRKIILEQGEIENYLNLVMKGMVRKYIPLKNGREVTTQLATEGHFIQSDISFNVRRPSEVILETVESSILIRMHYLKMQEMFDQHPWTEELGRLLVTQLAKHKDNRYYTHLNKTARERFVAYMTDYPHMLQRAPQKILASYLNIKPETFSRLKHLMRKRST